MLFGVSIILVLIFMRILVGNFIPFGNENSTVRRLPWVTFTILGLNVMFYCLTLPVLATDDAELERSGSNLQTFLLAHEEVAADDAVRKKLIETGLLTHAGAEEIEKSVKSNPEEFRTWLKGSEANKLRDEFDTLFTDFKLAREEHLFFEWGVSPNGNWKIYQLLTAAFLHGDIFHLFFNMVFLFAVAFSLEDLWGRSTFACFYLFGAIAASLPSILSPEVVPGIGASGAISAIMGAFLVRLPTVKLKLFLLISAPLMIFGRRPVTMMLPGFIYLISYIVMQILDWYAKSVSGEIGGTAYSVHVAGFVFGVAFAGVLKMTKTEENYLNPKIEAKVSFAASPVVTSALEMLDRGEAVMAERKLKAHIAKSPNDVDALMALIQIYQQLNNLEGLNFAYGQVIRHHLERQDKEAALYAYDNLLSSFPDNNVNPRISVRDWLTVCEYLLEAGMKREAAVEYERLVNAYPDDPLAVRACVQGGEAAMAAHDNPRALKLFQRAETMRPPSPLVVRIESGIEKVRMRLDNRPTWVKNPQQAKPISKDVDEQNVNW